MTLMKNCWSWCRSFQLDWQWTIQWTTLNSVQQNQSMWIIALIIVSMTPILRIGLIILHYQERSLSTSTGITSNWRQMSLVSLQQRTLHLSWRLAPSQVRTCFMIWYLGTMIWTFGSHTEMCQRLRNYSKTRNRGPCFMCVHGKAVLIH